MIGAGLLVAALGAFAGPDARTEADGSAERGEYAAALQRYEECASGGDSASRYCAAQVAVLAPQSSDGFAGWRVLEGVRREYRELAPGVAEARVRGELDRGPLGPAAPALRAWLANEELQRGQLPEPGGLGEADVGWVGEAAARAEQARRHTILAGFGGLAAALFLAVGAHGLATSPDFRRALRGALPLAAAGFVLLGLVPLGAAALSEPALVGPLFPNAVWAAVALGLARSVPAALGAVGTFGGFLALAGYQGWLVRLGVP